MDTGQRYPSGRRALFGNPKGLNFVTQNPSHRRVILRNAAQQEYRKEGKIDFLGSNEENEANFTSMKGEVIGCGQILALRFALA